MHTDEPIQDQGGHRPYHPHGSRYDAGLTRALPLLLAIWLAASGCAAGQASAVATQVPTHAASPTATRVVPPTPVGDRLGPVPTDCAVMPPPQTFTMASGFGGGFGDPVAFVGGSPVWELGLGSPLHAGQLSQDNPYPSFKVMWIVGPNVTKPVTLTGREMQTSAPLWFEIYPSNAEPISGQAPSVYTMRAVLDPGTPNRGSTDNSKGHWAIWGIGIVPLAAGCYELDVTSAMGQWHTEFAAGA